MAIGFALQSDLLTGLLLMGAGEGALAQ